MTKKQKRFIEEYLIDLNATQAAIRAGYSPDTAEQIGYQLLQKTSVSVEVSKAMAERSKRTGISQDRILLELAKMAFVEMTDVVDPETGKIKENASDDDLSCIQSVKVKPGNYGVEREVKLCDKKAALEPKQLSLFDDCSWENYYTWARSQGKVGNKEWADFQQFKKGRKLEPDSY